MKAGTYSAPNTTSDPQDVVYRTHGYRNLRLYGGFEGDESLASPEALHLEVIEVFSLKDVPQFGKNLVVVADMTYLGETQVRIFDSKGSLIVDQNLGMDPVLDFDRSTLLRVMPGSLSSKSIIAQIQGILGLSNPAVPFVKTEDEDGPQLRLFEIERVSDMPSTGRNRFFVARNIYSGEIHFRVFDFVGRLVADVSEAELNASAPELASLKTSLAPFWLDAPYLDEKAIAVNSIFGLVGVKVRDLADGNNETLIDGELGVQGDPSDNRKRLFAIDYDGRRRLKTLVVDGVTFKGAREGAFKLNPNSTQTLFRNCRFIDNYNLSSTGRGGAIENQGDLTLSLIHI